MTKADESNEVESDEPKRRRVRRPQRAPRTRGRETPPGPEFPHDAPVDEDGNLLEDPEVPEAWASKNGYDVESMRMNQRIRNYRAARSAGRKDVRLEIEDPYIRYAEIKRGNPDALISIIQVFPEKSHAIPQSTARAFPNWGHLCDYVKRYWRGGTASYKVTIYSVGGLIATTMTLDLSGPKEEESKPEPPQQPQQPQPPWGYPPNPYGPPPGYFVPPPAQPASPPPTPPPADAGVVPQLTHQITVLMQQNSTLVAEIAQLRQAFTMQQHAPAQPNSPFPPGWPLVLDPKTGTYRNALLDLTPAPAPAAAAEPPKPPVDPMVETEASIQKAEKMLNMVQRFRDRVAPPQPPSGTPAQPEPNPHSPVQVQQVGPMRVVTINDEPQTSAGQMIINNWDVVEGKIGDLFKKGKDAYGEVFEKKQKAVEAEIAAEREKVELAKRKQEADLAYAEEMTKKTERLADAQERARLAIERARQAAVPPPAEDLGELKIPRPDAVEDGAEAPPVEPN